MHDSICNAGGHGMILISRARKRRNGTILTRNTRERRSFGNRQQDPSVGVAQHRVRDRVLQLPRKRFLQSLRLRNYLGSFKKNTTNNNIIIAARGIIL